MTVTFLGVSVGEASMPRTFQVSAGIRFITVPRPDGSESHARFKLKKKKLHLLIGRAA